jgi:lipopolysaccharide export system protein LptA
MRTLVLAAGVLLVVALAVFLAIGKWKNPFNRRDLPQRLGIEIQQEANGVTYTQAHGGRTLFRIHASKVVQLKQGNALLHDVKIELYDTDGNHADRIEGSEFEYSQKDQTAKASGPVEITLIRPGTALAIAPKPKDGPAADDRVKVKGGPLATMAEKVESDEIHVKTSGLTFDQRSGVATTGRRVDFSMTQGSGSSEGATYDSQRGLLVLNRAVELNTERGGRTVKILAEHAEFEREARICRLHAAMADFRGGTASAGDARVLFRADGSAVRLDAVNGFAVVTETGGRVAAPHGSMDFNERNQPRHGRLEGGVTIDTVDSKPTEPGQTELKIHGTAPVAELEFTPRGELRHAHLERDVEIESQRTIESAGGMGRESRKWRSPVADLEFRNARQGHVEPATIHGTEGVTVTAESQTGEGPLVPSRLAADEVTGEFGPNSQISSMIGAGHARMEETNAAGIRQTSSGDRLEAHFAQAGSSGIKDGEKRDAIGGLGSGMQVLSGVLEGHVVLIQEAAAKGGGQAEAAMRATAGRAAYDGAGEWLHLTLSPRVEDGGLQLTAREIDVSRESAEAFAHGDVKATWVGDVPSKDGKQGSVGLGGQGPAHVVSTEARLRQSTGEATFQGHARLWQQADSIAGPVIVLDRQKRTLVARSTDAAEPVQAVLISAGQLEAKSQAASLAEKDARNGSVGKQSAPSTIRVRGGDLKYSDAERKALIRGGALGQVVAETGTATSISNEVELVLLPAGDRAGKDGGAAQVDRITARGRVTVTSGGRRGTGEQLVYSGETGEYVLTGTAAAPPKMTDPARGNVTGEALIFQSGDDRVSVEGTGPKTTTETTAPK